ncbi:MAG: uracil-DNA glycosylase [Clostridiales bacterium]|jgi:DNA polymerase|nr:uracil-DNA glycosylase [Clostridiales bacterium]
MLTWDELESACKSCAKCALCEKRKNVVIGTGNKQARIMFIGEAPGEAEDIQGEPFVGAAGKLLDKMLAAISLGRTDVYIANILKCRPPYNRDPSKEEQEKCLNYLRAQVALIKPKILVCLGRIAACVIIEENFKITRQRGLWFERKNYLLTATFHPSALLRDESLKKSAWEDFKAIKRRLNELS